MTRFRAADVWDRFLEGEALAPHEEEELLAALSADAELRAELLEDDKTDATLRAAGAARRDAEAFVGAFRDWLVAERDGTRFLRRVERDMRQRRTRAVAPVPFRGRVGFAAAGAAGLLLVLAVALGLLGRKPPGGPPTAAPVPPEPRETADEARAPELPAPPSAPERPRPSPDGPARPGPRPDPRPAPPSRPRPPEAAPDPRPVAGVARVEAVIGQVFAIRGGERRPLAAGGDLAGGEGVETVGQWSLAQIRFEDGTWLKLWGDTQAAEFLEGRADSGKRVGVTRGVVQAEVKPQPQGRPMVFVTPQGEAKVLGTILRLEVDPAGPGSTRLEVKEGRVLLTRAGEAQSVEVKGGFFAVAAPGAPLEAKPIVPERKKPGETRAQDR
jgi:hypothetical protein